MANAGRYRRVRHGAVLHPVLLHHRAVQRGGVRVRQHVRQGTAADDTGERERNVSPPAVFFGKDGIRHGQHFGHAVPVRDCDVLVRGFETNRGGVLCVHNRVRAVHTGGAVARIGAVVRHPRCPGVPHRGSDGHSNVDDPRRVLRDVQQHAGVHQVAQLVFPSPVRVHRDGGQRVQGKGVRVCD